MYASNKLWCMDAWGMVAYMERGNRYCNVSIDYSIKIEVALAVIEVNGQTR
jgi:hypothetical protein